MGRLFSLANLLAVFLALCTVPVEAGTQKLTVIMKRTADGRTIEPQYAWRDGDQICWESTDIRQCAPWENVDKIEGELVRPPKAAPITVKPGMPTVAMSGDEFCGNPYANQGARIVVRGLQFKKFIGNRVASFGTDGNHEIMVSNLPTDRTFSPGTWYDLVLVTLGVGSATNAYGAAISVPHAAFAGLP